MEATVLRSIVEITKDGEWGKGEHFDGSVRMRIIRGTDFAGVRIGELEGIPTRYIPEHLAARKRLVPFDILIETAGGTKDQPTGRTLFIKPSLIRNSALPYTCASFSRFIRIDSSKADPEYVFWLLQSLYHGGRLNRYHTQHTGVARFQFTTFAEQEPLFLPDRDQQRRVASILSAYDDLIENNTRRIKILEEMAQRLYREWFVHFRFPGHENIRLVESDVGPIPEGWHVPALDEITDYAIGGGWGEEIESAEFSIPAYVIRGTDIPRARHGDIKTSPLRWHKPSNFRSRELRGGDIVFEVSGGSKGQPVGRSVRVGQTLLSQFGGGTICASFCKLLRPKPGPGISASLYCFLREAYENGLIEKYQVQSTGISNFKFTAFMSEARLPMAPLDLMARFDSAVLPMLDQIALLGRRSSVLRATRDLLLPKLISGEISLESVDPQVDTADESG